MGHFLAALKTRQRKDPATVTITAESVAGDDYQPAEFKIRLRRGNPVISRLEMFK